MTTAELTADLAYNAADILSAATVQSKTYEIVDVDARAGVLDNRAKIDEISELIQGGVHYLGKTTTELSDGATTNPITVGGKSVTAKQGDMVSFESTPQDLEFIFNGTTWYEFGSTGSLKALAFKDSATASYTPEGSVSLTKSDQIVNLTGGAATFNEISVAASVTMDAYTPAGTIDIELAAPAAGALTADDITPTGSVTVTEITAATFAGNALTASGSFTGTAATIQATTTLPELPTLTVTQPTVNVTAPTTNVLDSATVVDGVLSFGTAAAVTSVAATATGGNTAYSTTYTQTLTATGSYTPEGDVSVTPGTPSGTISLVEKSADKTLNINKITPTGTVAVAAPTVTTKTFTGTAAAPTGTVTTTKFTPEATSVTGTVTIADVPTSASFNGTSATITAS